MQLPDCSQDNGDAVKLDASLPSPRLLIFIISVAGSSGLKSLLEVDEENQKRKSSVLAKRVEPWQMRPCLIYTAPDPGAKPMPSILHSSLLRNVSMKVDQRYYLARWSARWFFHLCSSWPFNSSLFLKFLAHRTPLKCLNLHLAPYCCFVRRR